MVWHRQRPVEMHGLGRRLQRRAHGGAAECDTARDQRNLLGQVGFLQTNYKNDHFCEVPIKFENLEDGPKQNPIF